MSVSLPVVVTSDDLGLRARLRRRLLCCLLANLQHWGSARGKIDGRIKMSKSVLQIGEPSCIKGLKLNVYQRLLKRYAHAD